MIKTCRIATVRMNHVHTKVNAVNALFITDEGVNYLPVIFLMILKRLLIDLLKISLGIDNHYLFLK